MKLFADTANVAEIRELAEWMVLDGVTTNPSLLAKEGKDPNEVFRAIAEIVNGPISAEVVAMDAKTMIEEGRRLAAIHPNIMVKVPMTAEGLRAVRALSAEGKKTNVTLIFSSPQALLAARAGATYVSPFIGRLDDGGQVGMDLLREIRTIFDNYGYDTNVLAASVRHSLHVVDAAIAGVDAVTAPPAVLRGLVKHSLTDQGIERFLADWKKLGAKI